MSTTGIDEFLNRWAAAEQAGDADAIRACITDDFVGVGPLGFFLPAAAWTARFGNGLHYDKFEVTDVAAREYGDTAVVTLTQQVEGTHGGNPVPSAVRASVVLRRTADDWRMAHIHMSFVAGTPGAPPIPGRG